VPVGLFDSKGTDSLLGLPQADFILLSFDNGLVDLFQIAMNVFN
jgi:hypothetical protein